MYTSWQDSQRLYLPPPPHLYQKFLKLTKAQISCEKCSRWIKLLPKLLLRVSIIFRKTQSDTSNHVVQVLPSVSERTPLRPSVSQRKNMLSLRWRPIMTRLFSVLFKQVRTFFWSSLQEQFAGSCLVSYVIQITRICHMNMLKCYFPRNSPAAPLSLCAIA